jgi:hypothetical protein
MEDLVCMIREDCNMHKYGGRIHVVDNMKTCIVYDVAQFPSELMDKLLRSTYVEILAESTSLSGYVVRLTLRPNKTTRVVTTAAVLACMCAVVTHCLKRDI